MENKKNLRLVLACFVPALIIGVILLVTPFIVSYARTHNRIYFYDYYNENVLDVNLKLDRYTAAGDKDYFVCEESLEQLGNAISEQLPEAEIRTYGNSLSVKLNKSYYYITDCGENTYSISDMAAVYDDGKIGAVRFLMPCHLVQTDGGNFSNGVSGITAVGGYGAWKDFYSSLDRSEEYTFNDEAHYIETLCKKGTHNVQGLKLRLQFDGNGKVSISSVG